MSVSNTAPAADHPASTSDPLSSSALDALNSMLRDEDVPVFAEPWQAEVFAMTLALNQAGVFSWDEWATRLSQSIQQAQRDGDPDLGDTAYRHWLDALEQLVVDRQIGSRSQLDQLHQAWDRAAHATPHGKPIELSD